MTEWVCLDEDYLDAHDIMVSDYELFGHKQCTSFHYGLWHSNRLHWHLIDIQRQRTAKWCAAIDCYNHVYSTYSFCESCDRKDAVFPCYSALIAFLCANKRKRLFPKDVMGIIANMVWESRYNFEVW